MKATEYLCTELRWVARMCVWIGERRGSICNSRHEKVSGKWPCVCKWASVYLCVEIEVGEGGERREDVPSPIYCGYGGGSEKESSTLHVWSQLFLLLLT